MSVRGLAVLAGRFALGLRMALRFCWNVWPSVHACLFSFVRKKETACGVLRFYFAGSRSPFARSRYVCMVICLWQVHFGFVRFFVAISTGYRDAGNERRGYEGTGLAAWTLRVFAQAHWRCCAFRGEYVGGYAPPNLRQRVFDSLDSLHAAAGLPWCGFAALVRLCAATLAL